MTAVSITEEFMQEAIRQIFIRKRAHNNFLRLTDAKVRALLKQGGVAANYVPRKNIIIS